MATALPLPESVTEGSRQHATRHADADYWINRLAEALQMSGQDSGQAYLFVVPEGFNGPGFVVRCNSTTLYRGFSVEDFLGNEVFVVLPAGGGGIASADNRDGLWVSEDIEGRAGFWSTSGGIRLAYGDPAGGDGSTSEGLAMGDADANPSTVPDGTHYAEAPSFLTRAGVYIWPPPGSKGRARYINALGHEDELAAPVLRRQIAVSAPGDSTTLVATGAALPTVATTNITPAVDNTANGPGVSYTTTAASGVDAGFISTFGLVRPNWGPAGHWRFMTDAAAVTSFRLAAGFVSAEIASNAGPAASGVYTTAAVAAWRYSTDVDVTAFLRCVTGDGANATVTTTTIPVAVGTLYELSVVFNAAGTACYFYSGRTLVATHTTNLPSVSTNLGCTFRQRTLAASTRVARFGHLRVSSR